MKIKESNREIVILDRIVPIKIPDAVEGIIRRINFIFELKEGGDIDEVAQFNLLSSAWNLMLLCYIVVVFIGIYR